MKKVLNLVTLMSLLPLTACGGQANLSGPQASTFTGQNAYMQPSYNYQQPAAAQPMTAAPQAAAPTAQVNAQTAARAAAPAPGTRIAPTLGKATAPVAAAAAPRAATTAPAAARPAAVAPAPAAASAANASRDLINKTREKFGQLQSFVVQGDAYEKDSKGETRIKLKVKFQQPGQIHLEIVQHNNSMYNGTKLTYNVGQNQVTGRPGGALSFMKLTVPLSDERILTRRGYRLDQVDPNAIMTRLLGNPALTPKVLGKTNINGHDIAVLEFTNANDFDKRITRELVGIDMQDYFVRIHEMYEGQTLVYSLKIGDAQYNVPLQAADFAI